jgi:predicted enzyme related to lactoylglutathione lyase
MPRPVHFEIPADDPERAIQFYSSVFGWKFSKWGGPMEYWLITTGEPEEPGINGGLLKRLDPNQPCVNTITVASVDESLRAIEQAGGACVLPKMAVPSVGWMAYCKDPDGHIFGIMQPDAAAA